MRPEYRVQLLELDHSEGLLVAGAMSRLEITQEPIGKPLRGGLAQCRSIRTGHNSRLRLVYQPIGDVADLIAVGKREGNVVYLIALEILES